MQNLPWVLSLFLCSSYQFRLLSILTEKPKITLTTLIEDQHKSEITGTSENRQIKNSLDHVMHVAVNQEHPSGEICPELREQPQLMVKDDDSKPVDEDLPLRVQIQPEQDQNSQLIPISKSDIRQLACSRTKSNQIQNACGPGISSNSITVPISPWIQLLRSLLITSVAGLFVYITVKVTQFFWVA